MYFKTRVIIINFLMFYYIIVYTNGITEQDLIIYCTALFGLEQ